MPLPVPLLMLLGSAQAAEPDARTGWFPERSDIVVANTVNVLATGLFLSRVHAPRLARPLGYASLAMAVPTTALAIDNFRMDRSLALSLPLLTYTAFVAMDVTLEALDVEVGTYPLDWRIAGPYLGLYFGSTGGMWGNTWRHGPGVFGVTGLTWTLNVGSSFYARGRGAG